MSRKLFDGQYRSKPQVSLRGASKQLERNVLFEKAHKDRKTREEERHKKVLALYLQALYRGHRIRTNVYFQFRSNFDQLSLSCSNLSDLLTLCRLFLVFYQKDKDPTRLVEMCKRWVQWRDKLLPLIPSSATWTFHLTHLLTYSTYSLSSPHLKPSLLLRTIEVYLSPASYPATPTSSLLQQLNVHLVQHHFFSHLLSFMINKTPIPQAIDEITPPLARTIFGYMTRPLAGRVGVVYKKLASEVLSRSVLPHVKFLVLPWLHKVDFDLELLIQSVGVCMTEEGVASSIEYLYSVLQLVDKFVDHGFHDNLIIQYLQLLSMLLSHAPLISALSEGKLDDEEEEGVIVGLDGQEGEEVSLVSPEGMLRHCLATISAGQLVPPSLYLNKPLPLPVLGALCVLCYQLVRHHSSAVHRKLRLLQNLAFSPSQLLHQLWTSLTTMTLTRTFGESVLCLQQLARGLPLPSLQGVLVMEQLSTFCVLFSLKLFILHDAEFYKDREIPESSHMPFSLHELVRMITTLRDIFLTLHLEKHTSRTHTMQTRPHPQEWLRLKSLLLALLSALYSRDCRRAFCPEGHWVAPSLRTDIPVPPQLFAPREGEEAEEEKGVASYSPLAIKHAQMLLEAPFLFPFVERVHFLKSLVHYDRSLVQGHLQEFLQGRSFNITVRRDHVYEDAFTYLSKEDLRNKVRVQYVNSQGLSEPGIDGGGVFREFLNDVLKTGFDPNRGYFSTSPEGELYPNPQSFLINEDSALHYNFLGNVLGKALYEDQLVDLPFAGFFLSKLAVGGRGFVGIHHLASLDPELYRNLLSLKYYEGNIEDLALNFTIATEHLGQSRVYELKQGGIELTVNKSNYLQYIYLMAHYKLNIQLHPQYQSFRTGLEQVIPAHWLRLFSQNELQVLISGARVPINISDLRLHTIYKGEYNADHECVVIFWEVVQEFKEEEKQLLLKFVTSCGRPPLLGFKELHPPFTISMVSGDSHLPSASTCSNLLLLPQFKDKDTMRTKLVYAIQSGAGFELS